MALIAAVSLNAQSFQNTIGKADAIEYGESISQAADSTYIIAGDYTTNFFASNVPYIMHLKKNGSIDWSKKISIPSQQSIFLSITHAETVKSNSRPDGYIMLIDVTSSFYIVRFNNAGAVTWAREFKTGATGVKVKPSYDLSGNLTGFIALANRTSGANAGALIIKIGTTGNTLWQKRITYNVADTKYRLADIQATTDGGCVAVGNIYQGFSTSIPAVFRISSIGTIIWGHTYVFTGVNQITPVLKGVAITNTGFAVVGDNGNNSSLVFSINSIGVINWAFNYSSGSPLYQPAAGSTITSDASNNLIIGCSPDPVPGESAAIFKLTAAGIVSFAKIFNSSTSFHDIKTTNTGTYCAVGLSGPGNDADISVVNISSTGTIKSGCQPTSFNLSFANTFTKLLGNSFYGMVNEALTNTSVAASSANIQTEQLLCGGRGLDDIASSKMNAGKLIVVNEVAAKRIMIKWSTPETNDEVYQATLYNDFGQPIKTTPLKANEAVYIPMSTTHAGFYYILLEQNSEIIAKEKVPLIK